MLSVLFVLQAIGYAAAASCACGYRDSTGSLWRESIVSDFSGSDALSVLGENWAVQDYGANHTYQYLQYSTDNVYNYNDALGIRTKAWSGNGSVYSGEIQTNRADILYGTFRMYAKIPTTPGVCFGFFSYYSDSQETDIEFLTNDTDYKNTVHYTNQPRTTDSATQQITVSDDLTSYNEHRFDWSADETVFYVNGDKEATISVDVPSKASNILANVWSDGDPTWSTGPPSSDAVANIQYIKLYFNSTSTNETAFDSSCSAAGDPVCEI